MYCSEDTIYEFSNKNLCIHKSSNHHLFNGFIERLQLKQIKFLHTENDDFFISLYIKDLIQRNCQKICIHLNSSIFKTVNETYDMLKTI